MPSADVIAEPLKHLVELSIEGCDADDAQTQADSACTDPQAGETRPFPISTRHNFLTFGARKSD